MYDALEDVDTGDYRDWGGKSFFAHDALTKQVTMDKHACFHGHIIITKPRFTNSDCGSSRCTQVFMDTVSQNRSY